MTANWLRWVAFFSSVVVGAIALPAVEIQADTPVNAVATPSREEYTDRLIVKLRDSKTAGAAVMSATQVRGLSAAAGVTLSHFRAMSGDAQVLKLPHRMTVAEAAVVAEQLKADPAVEYAEPDRILRPLLVPNDPRYADQWHYKSPNAPDNVVGGANLPGAWDITTGSTNIVVAVLDTGLLPHADIDSNILDGSGRVVPGYDFVSADPGGGFFISNDGDGRDADPTDPGDWATQAEVDDPSTPCTDVSNSSWHGTHVAGTIGANGNNATGVTGINWVSKILPVRVLGKCGGFVSDSVDGIRWAAGLPVVGVPANSNPAKVLNISLGGTFRCIDSMATQNAINDAVGADATVVVAAGNEFGDAATATPASCNNVITVTAVDRNGAKPGYANTGATVEIAAPGGSQHLGSNGILSTLNTGLMGANTSPGGDTYNYYQGTSMAAPHVTGIVSLMLSVKPSLTPAQVLATLQATARPFPTGTASDCNTSLCGAGIVDAAAAVAAIWLQPSPIPVGFPSTDVALTSAAQTVTLTNNSSSSITFTNITTSGDFAITNGGSCTATTVLINPSESCTVALTFTPTAVGTRSGGLSVNTSTANSTTMTVSLSGTGVVPPPPSSGGGGGGGCFIATAAYGTPMAAEVRYLRAFRDQYLLTNAIGRVLTEWYYKFSPPVADFLRAHDGLRAVVRAALRPHVEMSRALVSTETVNVQTADRP